MPLPHAHSRPDHPHPLLAWATPTPPPKIAARVRSSMPPLSLTADPYFFWGFGKSYILDIYSGAIGYIRSGISVYTIGVAYIRFRGLRYIRRLGSIYAMARYPETYLLKLSEGTLARIDGLSGNRADFIRDAIEVALEMKSAGRSQLAEVRSEGRDRPKVSAAREVERGLLLGAVREKPGLTERKASEVLGWPVGRVGKVAKGLADAGLVRFEGGGLVPND